MCQSTMMSLIRLAGTTRPTVWLLLFLLAVLLVCHFGKFSYYWLFLPLALLSLNLLAAFSLNQQLRRSYSLWFAHVLTLLFIASLTLETLTGFEGRIEIADGQAFSPQHVTVTRTGMLGENRMSEIGFVQGPIRVEYLPGLQRARTESTVVLDGEKPAERIVGDLNRLYLAGYRFSTTSNKGYAALLEWTPSVGETTQGYIHFPSFPLRDWQQHQEWVAPSGEAIEFRIDVTTPELESRWEMDISLVTQSLGVNIASDEKILKRGDEVTLSGGSLRFVGNRVWIGYKIDSHLWFFSMLISGFLLLAFLGLFMLLRFNKAGATQAALS